MTQFFIAFFVHIMKDNHAKFQKTFDSRTISRELPWGMLITIALRFSVSRVVFEEIVGWK